MDISQAPAIPCRERLQSMNVKWLPNVIETITIDYQLTAIARTRQYDQPNLKRSDTQKLNLDIAELLRSLG